MRHHRGVCMSVYHSAASAPSRLPAVAQPPHRLAVLAALRCPTARRTRTRGLAGKQVELPLDSWWHPAARVPGWACGVNGAASRQLVVSHRWGTRLGVWCKWSGLSTAGGSPPLGYPAGRVV
jgi:hypothetical protein